MGIHKEESGCVVRWKNASVFYLDTGGRDGLRR